MGAGRGAGVGDGRQPVHSREGHDPEFGPGQGGTDVALGSPDTFFVLSVTKFPSVSQLVVYIDFSVFPHN